MAADSLRHLLAAIAIALGFSAFIYIDDFGLPHVAAVETALALGAYYGLLSAPRRVVILAGFFIGLAWFYWVGYSFRYYNMAWIQPFVSLFFGFVYALYFGVITLAKPPWLRATLLFGVAYVAPFGFNWMVPELPFLYSYLGIEKWQFAVILASLALAASLRSPLRYAALLLLPFAYAVPAAPPPPAPLKIKLVENRLPQEQKWEPSMQAAIVADNFRQIDKAIDEGYDLVVLPESVFPLFLNHRPDLVARLAMRSQEIAIITGALFDEHGNNYNVTYFFRNGQHQVAKKTVLVPFGEYIPLPRFIGHYVNDLIFDGASDYLAAETPTDFNVSGTLFRNAICYEATCEPLYAGDPHYMVAISNNAWFTPSIEPALQKLLMQYYARRHGTIIYHSANMDGTGIVQ